MVVAKIQNYSGVLQSELTVDGIKEGKWDKFKDKSTNKKKDLMKPLLVCSKTDTNISSCFKPVSDFE